MPLFAGPVAALFNAYAPRAARPRRDAKSGTVVPADAGGRRNPPKVGTRTQLRRPRRPNEAKLCTRTHKETTLTRRASWVNYQPPRPIPCPPPVIKPTPTHLRSACARCGSGKHTGHANPTNRMSIARRSLCTCLLYTARSPPTHRSPPSPKLLLHPHKLLPLAIARMVACAPMTLPAYS